MARPPLQKCDYGYKCLFRETDGVNMEDFYCGSCRRVATRPSITTCCGEQYCEAYLQAILEEGSCSSSSSRGCPHCDEKDFRPALVKQLNTKIEKLSVFCILREHGCNWEGVVGEYGNHEGNCEHVLVPCNSCNKQVKRGEVNKHLREDCPKREFSCPHCNYKGNYDFVVSAHYAVCSYFPKECPNKCGVKGERNDMEEHLKVCPEHYHECKFHYVGCTEKYKLCDEAAHLKEHTTLHTEYLGSKVSAMSADIECLVADNSSLHEEIKKSMESHDARDREIAELRDKLEKAERKISELEKYQAAMPEDEVSPPEDRERKDVELKLEKEMAEMKEKQKKLDIQYISLKGKMENMEKVINSPPVHPHPQMLPEVLPQPPQQADLAESTAVPPFILKNYSVLKRKKEQWKSDPFTCQDYTVTMNVWPAGQGEGENTHMSVWLELQSHTQNATPTFFFFHLELQDQNSDSSLRIRIYKAFPLIPNTRRNRYEEIGNQFVPHSKVVNYLKNDTLKFKVLSFKAIEMCADNHLAPIEP